MKPFATDLGASRYGLDNASGPYSVLIHCPYRPGKFITWRVTYQESEMSYGRDFLAVERKREK